MKEELKEECIRKWNAEDSRMRYFKEHFDEFNNSLDDELDDCMELLLLEFDYYSHKLVNQEYKKLHSRLVEEYGLSMNDTIFTILKSQRNTFNSSYAYIPEYKVINNVNKNNIILELSDWWDDEEAWGNINNIVIIDDFCGTGKTFCDYLETIKDKLLDKTIFYVIIHIMEKATNKIKDFASENKIEINIVCNNEKKAAFMINDRLKEKKDIFEVESKKRNISKKDVLGYQESEALVAFFENTPNNTLVGIYRYLVPMWST